MLVNACLDSKIDSSDILWNTCTLCSFKLWIKTNKKHDLCDPVIDIGQLNVAFCVFCVFLYLCCCFC